ncbi:uncharacterized protein B0J16DRAFT_385285 [Fusarium flagelliforme]|uniref:uncharacterized protein n=1 Tax=Fusarium flagelliforme TaxID=2675880 RepID=UPI001E8CF1E9|nr:uncharacterized protein B0J16DRAFT_385285 [Fusarium flagelliforme]KAH7186254.1 hypothetical protein B0J16DRAFT_385285 [Fusarium flagelliforme]
MLLFLFLTILVSGMEYTDFSYDGNFTDPPDRFRPGNNIFPLAEGTRSDCILYYWLEDVTDDYSADCWSLASVVGATSEELILWNPSLAEPNGTSEIFEDLTAIPTTLDRGLSTFIDGFTWPCTIAPSKSYCVVLSSATASSNVNNEEQPPTPRAADEISGCTMWLDVPKGITCDDLMIMNNLHFGEFFEMNPSVGADCSGVMVGMNYCKSTHAGGWDFGIPGWSSSESDDDLAS